MFRCPMARSRDTRARKAPRQQRSRETVAAILSATARCLVRHGFAGTTTNRVAELAGVSVGSLYQYFPNKRALVRALYDRHVADAERLRPPPLQVPPGGDGDGATLTEVVVAAVAWHVAAHALEPRLHAELDAHASDIVGATDLRTFEDRHEARVRARLEAHRGEIEPGDLDLAAFLIATCLEAVPHAAAKRRPELLGSAELRDELAAMLLGYLKKRRVPASAARRRRERGDRRTPLVPRA